MMIFWVYYVGTLLGKVSELLIKVQQNQKQLETVKFLFSQIFHNILTKGGLPVIDWRAARWLFVDKYSYSALRILR